VEVSTTQASLASISTEATDVEVEAKDVGDLFEYDLKQRSPLARTNRALVPIVFEEVADVFGFDFDVGRLGGD